MVRIGLVVPFYKKELFSKFLDAWGYLGDDVVLYAIEDNPKKSFKKSQLPEGTKYYCWKDIEKDLGKDDWIISRRSSAIRSYGYLKAYQDGMNFILTLDDDCYPTDDNPDINSLIRSHMMVMRDVGYSSYFHVGDFFYPGKGLWMRGSPVRYRKPRDAIISVGGWDNNPDLDAWTQLENNAPKLTVTRRAAAVQKYSGLTMCGMNLFFHRALTPLMYFLLQGEFWGVDRVDDIWCGLFCKKVLDKFDTPMVINGYATVRHERASNAMDSLKKEGITLQETELLWDRLIPLQLEGSSFEEAYKDLAEKLEPTWLGEEFYGEELKEAMKVWVRLFGMD